VAVLATLGSSHTHQRNFLLFLGAVVVLSLLTVAVFVLTAPRDRIDSGAGGQAE
jgi:hypothetical protein